MQTIFLESDRLSFLRPGEADLPRIEEILRARADQDRTPELHTDDKIHAVARGILDRWKGRPYGTCLIQSRASKEIVGLGGLKDLEIQGEMLPDLGLMFLEAHQRKGLGFEAGAAVIHHAFNVLQLPRIVANTTLENDGALRLLERWGFAYVKEVTYEFAGVVHAGSRMSELTREEYLFGPLRQPKA